MPFENNTLEIYLAEELRDSIINSFQRDGRLRISYENPDSIISGLLSSYEHRVFGYDIDQNIEEYQVRISLSITFTDLIRNEVIWENLSLSLSERYTPLANESVKFSSEHEAVNEIFKKLFDTIIRNSLESW